MRGLFTKETIDQMSEGELREAVQIMQEKVLMLEAQMTSEKASRRLGLLSPMIRMVDPTRFYDANSYAEYIHKRIEALVP